jgi:hypothetical protein
MRKVLLAVRHRQRSTGEHPYFNHGSAGTILNSLRAAVGTTWHQGYYPDSTEAAEWYYMQAIRRHIEQHFGAEAAELALQKYAVKAISVRGCCKRVLVDDHGVPQQLQLAK